ncbi:MAG: polyhydroxyalkanoate synthesis regulator DNA-binding domain-containing protein [Isosphaeraceae bacterium]
MSDETTVEIRRYPNRRLYDRSRRQYVTLQDIEAMVLAGTNVEVRDSRTGEDLTRQVLTQIMMERHPQKMDMFPVAMLHNMLRANDLAVEMWRGYLRQSVAAVDAWQTSASPFAAPLNWMSAMFPTMTAPFMPGAPGSPGAAASATPPTSSAAPTPPTLDPHIAERLDALADRIERLEGGGNGRHGSNGHHHATGKSPVPVPEPEPDAETDPEADEPPMDRLEHRVDRLEERSVERVGRRRRMS